MSLLIQGGTIFAGLGGEQVVADGGILVAGETIEAFGSFDELRAAHPEAELLGGPEYIVLPGLTNAHDHARGLDTNAQGLPDEALELWMLGFERPAPGSEYLRTLWTGLRLIRSGVTTTNHCLAAVEVEATERNASEALRAYGRLGLRAGLVIQQKDCNYLALDDAGLLARLPTDLARRVQAWLAARPKVARPALLDVFDSLRASAARDVPRVRLLLGPGAPWRASDELLRALRAHASQRGAGLHMHLLETRYQRDYGFRAYGESLIAHLERLGFLGPDLTLAHCVWPAAGDLERLAANGVAVSHNLSSNLRLRSGRAPLREMLEAGLTVGLGLDGLALDADGDLLSEMRLVWRLHAEPGIGGWSPTPQQVLRMASANGARATLGVGFPGAIEPGAPADLVLLDLRRCGGPSRPGGPDPLATTLALARPSGVDTVLIGGRVVLRGGRFVEIDEEAVERALLDALDDAPPAVVSDAEQALLSELHPHLARYYASFASRTDESRRGG